MIDMCTGHAGEIGANEFQIVEQLIHLKNRILAKMTPLA